MLPIGPVNLTHTKLCSIIGAVITHPASESMRRRASNEPGAARVAAERKWSECSETGARGHRFVPFAMETYGRLGKAAGELLREWAADAAGAGAFDRAAHLTWMKRELSVVLERGNARLFQRFVGVLTHGIGQRFVEGMQVPVLDWLCVTIYQSLQALHALVAMPDFPLRAFLYTHTRFFRRRLCPLRPLS